MGIFTRYRRALMGVGLMVLWFSVVRAADRPLNIVLLYADDWRHDTLGCAGHPVVRTPHLDGLAAEGVRFRNNYVTTSICGVSRASLLTGQWMSRHGNRAFAMFKTPWEMTYPAMLRGSGYHVGHVGKWHNGGFPAERYDFGRAYSGRHWMGGSADGEVHVTRKNGDDAMEFLRNRPKDKPFCLTVAFFATHAEDGNPKQYLPQPASMEWYRDVRIPVPRTATDAHFAALPAFVGNEKNEGRRRWHWRFDEEGKYQEMMRNYYRLATEVDGVCGEVLAELKAQGLSENTLVIFTTDNGYFHGEHGLADKWYPHEESIRVPLIIRDPRAQGVGGKVESAMTLNVDLAPTVLAAAGVGAPGGMQGRDLSVLYRGGAADWRTEFFYEHAVIRSSDFIPASEALVRVGAKYMYWPDFGREQLFDLEKDPLEERDVIGDGAYAGLLGEMRERFGVLKSGAR